jgi:hypothetical protein
MKIKKNAFSTLVFGLFSIQIHMLDIENPNNHKIDSSSVAYTHPALCGVARGITIIA